MTVFFVTIAIEKLDLQISDKQVVGNDSFFCNHRDREIGFTDIG